MLTDGQRVRLARLGRGWTLQDLADRCTFSLSYLSKIENDEREIPEIVVETLDLKKAIWYEKLSILLKFSDDDFRGVIASLKNALYLN